MTRILVWIAGSALALLVISSAGCSQFDYNATRLNAAFFSVNGNPSGPEPAGSEQPMATGGDLVLQISQRSILAG